MRLLSPLQRDANGFPAGDVKVSMTERELRMVRSALTEVLREIELPEFFTRVGVKMNVAQALLDTFGRSSGKRARPAKRHQPTSITASTKSS